MKVILGIMSLDVYVQPKAEMPRIGDESEHICSFVDDEGYYWFLYPLFEKLREETGEFIDLYGGATFSGVALDALAQTIVEAHKLVDAQPDSWEVVTGVITKPVRKEVRASVNKQQMKMLLAKLEEAVSKAKTRGAYVTFWGD